MSSGSKLFEAATNPKESAQSVFQESTRHFNAAMDTVRQMEHPDRTFRPSVALVTDHEAMPNRQRRPLTARGASYFLNKFFTDLYGEDGKSNGQVFFVPGVKNIADAVSRETKIGEGLSYVVLTDRALPALNQFHHPFLKPKERAWWNK